MQDAKHLKHILCQLPEDHDVPRRRDLRSGSAIPACDKVVAIDPGRQVTTLPYANTARIGLQVSKRLDDQFGITKRGIMAEVLLAPN